MPDEILEGKNVNLSNLHSFANLQVWAFGLYHINIWLKFVLTFGKSCIYGTYLISCIVPACCSPSVLTLISVSCILFESVLIAFQWFGSVFFSSVIYLACVCIPYLYLWYIHLQFMLIRGFEIVFCIIKSNLLTSVPSLKFSHLSFSVFCL